MIQICPCAVFEIVVVLGFAVYLIAIVKVYRRTRSPPSVSPTQDAKKNDDATDTSRRLEKEKALPEDAGTAILREISEKLADIDAIAKFAKARSITDKLAEAQEKTNRMDSARAKINDTVKALKSSESPHPDSPKLETVAEKTKETLQSV